MLAALEEVGEDLLTLGIADLLQDDLLGRLRADAPEVDRLQRLLQRIARLDFRIVLARLGKRHLEVFIDVLVVGDHLPATEGLVIAGFAIDRHPHIGFVMDALLGRRSQRQFQGAKDDFLADVLLAGQCVDQQQNFTAHGLKPPSPSVESRHQTCPVDIIEFEFHVILFQTQADLALLETEQFTLEVAAAVLRDAQPDLDVVPGEAREIPGLLDDAIETRRRDFETVIIDTLDLEEARELIGHAGAVFDIDPVLLARQVDEDANGPATGRHLDIDEFIAETDHGRFKQRV